MKAPSIFDFTDYKLFLQARLSKPWGAISQASSAAGCQRSYLSRAIHGVVHLTQDHVFRLSKYWDLTSTERDYFFTLLDHARAGSKEYRKDLERKLKRLKQQNEDLSNRTKRPRIEPGEKEVLYYSAWYWSAIHILVTIPEFQTVRSISQRLSLPEATVLSTLKALEKFHFVEHQGDRWISSQIEVHIPKNSLLVGLHHNNWRQRAILNAQLPHEDGIHYTIVQSMSQIAFEKIKQIVLDFIDETAKVAGPSKEEELVCVSCDLFRV